MSSLKDDLRAAMVLATAFVAAAALAVVAWWSSGGETPEHWARGRFLLLPLALCVAAGLACLWSAWQRRAHAAQWLPLVGGALTCAASVLAMATGAF